MKTRNLNLKALILILAVMIAGQSFAHKYNNTPFDEKKVVKINMNAQLVKFISQALDISEEDLKVIKYKIENTDFYMTNSNSGNLSISFDYHSDSPELEDWMFEEDYLGSTECCPQIEDWMLADNYYETESAPEVEDWMFEEYSAEEASPEIETWMLEEDYFGSTECCPQIEDWMMDENYYETESGPELEDWMTDLSHYDQ